MSVFHDEVEIEDFDWDDATQLYTYPCPCGDRFQISKEELAQGEDIARCPSCSLIIRVIYNPVRAARRRPVAQLLPPLANPTPPRLLLACARRRPQEDFMETEDIAIPVEVST